MRPATLRGLTRAWLLSADSLLSPRALLLALAAWRSWLRLSLIGRLRSTPPPTHCLASIKHRRWMLPLLERMGWQPGPSSSATFFWQLSKKLLPAPDGAVVFNCLPNLLLLDDKAVLAMLTRQFTRTRPLVTHVLYGEWDGTRPAHCSRPRAARLASPRARTRVYHLSVSSALPVQTLESRHSAPDGPIQRAASRGGGSSRMRTRRMASPPPSSIVPPGRS